MALMALNVTSARPGSRSSAGAITHVGTMLSKSSFSKIIFKRADTVIL